MPRLIALTLEDGWAFVREGGRFVLVHPPFRTEERRVVHEYIVTDAVVHHGYIRASPDTPEEPWPNVIARIREAMERALGPQTDSASFIDRALGVVPMTMIGSILDEIEQTWIPRLKLEGADRALRRLMREERVRREPALLDRALELLDRVAKVRDQRTDAKRETLSEKRLVATRLDPKFAQRRQSFGPDRRAGLFGG